MAGADAVGVQWCCGHLATALAPHKLAGNASRSRIAHRSHLRASDRRAWKVASWPRRLCAKASVWLARTRRCGRRAALAVSATGRDAADASRTARRGCVGHTVALPAPESSHRADVVGRPCQSKLFRLARSAALRPSRGSHDAGLPRRRRRCKPHRTPRPCWPAAALMAPQTRHVATMGVVDRLPRSRALRRLGYARRCGCCVGASGCENASGPRGPRCRRLASPPPAALAPSSAMRVKL